MYAINQNLVEERPGIHILISQEKRRWTLSRPKRLLKSGEYAIWASSKIQRNHRKNSKERES